MGLTFVICSSESFMNRTKVCIDSVKKHHPNAKIVFEKMENPKNGGYVKGLARRRLEIVKKLLPTLKFNDIVVVLGADCVFYAPIWQNYFDLSELDKVMLFPHVITPPKNNVKQLYRTGHANADLILFKRGAVGVVDWLLKQDLDDNLQNGSFYEQTFISALPFISEGISINKHPGINYAYFNHHERNLHKKDNNYFVNDEPLIMVQYSGFIEGQPERMSKYHSGSNATGAWLELLQEYDRNIRK